MKLLFLINPIAGGLDHAETIGKLKAMTDENSYQSQFILTSGKNDERKLQSAIDSFQPDRVVVGGGDGTVRMASRILIEYKLPLGIIPMGSANGLATALAIPQDPVLTLDRILHSNTIHSIDMLRFNNEHFCIHLADIGTNALLIKKYEESGVRGMIGYAKHFIASIKESTMMKAIVRTTDGLLQKEGIMMAFANAHKYGTGVQISEGSVSDGKFEICNVERFTLEEAIKAGLTALNVFLDPNMFSDVLSCSQAEVDLDQKVHFQVDGEYMGLIDHLTIEVIPSCVKLVV